MVLLGCVIVVNLLADSLSFAKISSQIFLLLFVVMPQELLPVIWIHILLLLNDLSLDLFNLDTAIKNYKLDNIPTVSPRHHKLFLRFHIDKHTSNLKWTPIELKEKIKKTSQPVLLFAYFRAFELRPLYTLYVKKIVRHKYFTLKLVLRQKFIYSCKVSVGNLSNHSFCHYL